MNEEHWFNDIVQQKDLIKIYLLEHCSGLDLEHLGADYMIYNVCCDDILMFLKYLKRNNMETDKEFTEYFARFVLNTSLDDKYYHEFTPDQFEKYKVDANEFAKMLVNEWWKKYLVRTKVVFKNNKEAQVSLASMKAIDLHSIFTPEEWDEISEYIQEILFRNGERCFIRILIENVAKSYLKTNNKVSFSHNDKVQFMEKLGTEAKRMCYVTGVLVWMFPNYNARVREWRNDNAAVQF
jgi:hypothetical protein